MIKLNIDNAKGFVTPAKISKYSKKIDNIKQVLLSHPSMTDWLNIETTISNKDLTRVKQVAKQIRDNCEVFIVLGVGGSYLGAKAVIEALSPYFNENKPEILFAGNNLSGEYLSSLIEHIKNKEVIVNVISKSGTTMETSLAFNSLLEALKKKYGKNYNKNLIITTNSTTGKMHEFAEKEKIISFEIPENIGGRFSVLSPVGLLPIAVSGINIDSLLLGAKNSIKEHHSAYDYAVCRYIMYKKNRDVEAITYYEPKLEGFSNWIQQLFAESHGKNKKGILPMENLYTTNLHSIGQFLQDGKPIVFETLLSVTTKKDMKILHNDITFSQLTKITEKQVAIAHEKGGTPTLKIEIGELNEKSLGELIYFFFISAAAFGYLIGENPYDQSGVEAYKKEIKNGIDLKI